MKKTRFTEMQNVPILMLKSILLLFLLAIACTPLRNPYYKSRFVIVPYMEVYVVNNERNDNYMVNGRSTKKDTFDILIPKTLKGKYDAGIAVGEIALDKNDQILNISLVGMTLYDMEGKTRAVYDKYCIQCKKIDPKIPVYLSEYDSVLKESIKSFSFKRKAHPMSNSMKAYIFIEFYKPGYENIYIN
jgi:hypothetical protein